MSIFRNRARNAALLVCLLLIPFGLALKGYAGPGRFWVNNYAAGVVYVVFFTGFFFSFNPRRSRLLPVTLTILFATSLLEILQLWRHPGLESLRRNFWGRALLGSDFDWLDFPHYALGSLAAFFLFRFLTGKTEDSSPKPPV